MKRVFYFVLVILCFLVSCKQQANKPQGRGAEDYVPDPESVAFDIEALHGGNGTSQWLATYSSQSKVARFKIEFGVANDLPDKESKEFHIQSGEGRFVAQPGSDASVLLVELKRALHAKRIPSKVRRLPSLSFDFVILGEHQSREADGGFSPKPQGDWSAIKIFLGEAESESELFLNINPVIRKGEFSMKDPDYGDPALAALAGVL
jgi:hypothetical protein